MSGILVAPSIRELPTLARQLEEWLSAKMPNAKAVRVENLDYPRGAGQSHETILFDAAWTEDGREVKQGMVVRIKPSSHTVFQDDMFEEQYQVMDIAGRSGKVRVAKVFWLERDPTLLGAPFFIMEKLKGRVAVSIPPYMQEGWVVESTPQQRATMWESGVRQLAAIQHLDVADFGFLSRPEDGATGFDQEWGRWARYLRWLSQDEAYPHLETALEQLDALKPKNRPEGLVWGDARLGNQMIDDSYQVAAVMDWEQISLGGALHDLGWWLAIQHGITQNMPDPTRGLEGFGTREETIALWAEASGKSAADIEWYEAFASFKLSCLSSRLMALRGMPMTVEQHKASPINQNLVRRIEGLRAGG
jgi:aminoglycoside phosphotransferase (APT) family kinase protein